MLDRVETGVVSDAVNQERQIMTPIEWFVSGGPWMWILLCLTVLGIAVSIVASALLFSRSPRTVVFRRVAGVLLVVIAVLCAASGFIGYSQAKGKANAFAEANSITDPEFFAVFNREARIPLEASIPVGSLFGILGLFTALRKPRPHLGRSL